MSQIEQDVGLKIFDKHYQDRDEKFRVVRKGKTGSWRECFAPHGTIDTTLREAMNAQGLDMLTRLGYVKDDSWDA